MNENKKIVLPMIMIVLLICSFATLGKDTEIVKNIVFKNFNFIYPLTFILSAYMIHNIGSRTSQKVINYSVLTFFIFIISLMFISTFRSNDTTYYFRASLEFIFTPKSLKIGSLNIAYPDLIKTILFIGGYYISQTLFITLYNSLKDMAPKTIVYLINYLISYIINVIIYTGGLNLVLMINKEIEFNDLIINLTSGFLIALLTCVITTFIYLIINIFTKKNKNNILKTVS